jgi:predicted MFS family arabinose efflux permease
MQILSTAWGWFCLLNMLAPIVVGLWMWLFPETPEQREAARREHKQRVREHFERMNNNA